MGEYMFALATGSIEGRPPIRPLGRKPKKRSGWLSQQICAAPESALFNIAHWNGH